MVQKAQHNNEASAQPLAEADLYPIDYCRMIDQLTVHLVKYKPDGTILFVNQTMASRFGVERSFLIGKNLFSLLGEAYHSEMNVLLEEIRTLKAPRIFELETPNAAQEMHWISWITQAIFGEDGEPIHYISEGVVVQQLKETETKLKETLEELEELKKELENENKYLRTRIVTSGKPETGIYTQSAKMLSILDQLQQVSATDAPVLIYGETGTGKELIAQAIHNGSHRKHMDMVIVNCGALPPSLIESELFGREKGAYTGALSRQIGRFELAHRSTIFLDEVGELPLEVQVKLLRAIQFGEFQMLGSNITKRVDVRIVAATNRDLHGAIAAGTFRSDLYYRLGVFPINLPPLRERKEDIPLLAWHFIDEIAGHMGKQFEKISTQGMKKLIGYHWPGNIRELRNIIEFSLIVSNSKVLEINLPDSVLLEPHTENLEDEQRRHIIKILEQCNWKIRGADGAAEKLGMKESTLRFRMKKLGIAREE